MNLFARSISHNSLSHLDRNTRKTCSSNAFQQREQSETKGQPAVLFWKLLNDKETVKSAVNNLTDWA